MGYKLASTNSYDLIILDIILPGRNGLEVCRQIRKHDNLTPILMLTALGTTEDKVSGLDSGADDYLTKPFKLQEFLARVRALTRRKNQPTQSGILKIADLELNTDTKEVKRNNQPIQLTVKEFALLEYFMRNQKRVLSRVQIAENVWDLNFDTGTNIIDVYVKYLRDKVDKNSEKKLIHTVFGVGYVMKES